MKKELQIGVRVGLPACFALKVEDVYRHAQGAHRALAFPDFLGLLIGLGLERYRKGSAAADAGQEEEDIEEEGRAATLSLFDMNPAGRHDLFREFDEAMEPPEDTPGLRLVHVGEVS